MSQTTAKGTIVVTGGSRGIGAALSPKLAALGYAVAVNYTSNPDLADGVVKAITGAGGRAAAVKGDVSDEADVAAMFDAAAELGPLYGLVNSAGVLGGNFRVQNMDVASVRRMFEINVIGTMLCAREAVRRLSTNNGGTGGAIVNMASAASRLGGAGELVHYATSKGAIDSFTMGLAREVGDEGIRVNAVSPGVINTEMNSPERQARVIPTIPMKRAGQPEEVAEAIIWLLSPAASYITGSILTISGGR